MPRNQDRPGSEALELLAELSQLRLLGRTLDQPRLEKACAGLWPEPAEQDLALRALQDPFLALTMLWRTLGQGFRGNPLHPRPHPSQGQRLIQDLMAFFRLHLRLRGDLAGRVDWPQAGVPASALRGSGGWCDLCGECCAHAGTVPTPPTGITYPPYWYHALAGHTLYPQPFCPFLFQSRQGAVFFCSIHPIKPLACRDFDATDCQRGRPGRGGPA